VVSIVGSIGMIIPVMVVLINLWYTAKGKLGQIQADVGAKFVLAGSVIYLFTCIQGPAHSLPVVQRITHFSNWVVAHAHGSSRVCRVYSPGWDVLHLAENHREAYF
jgi:cbb3-type cytochrome oxidase subunit 1